MTFRLIKILFAIVLLCSAILYIVNIWPVWPVILIILFYLSLVLILSSNIRFNFFVRAYNNNPDFSENAVALSFDDGPEEFTLEILDILDKFGVKSAFFCIGKNIEKHPEIFKEIIRRGHIVGNHSYSHTRLMGFLGRKKIIEEIERCNEIAEKVGGVNMKLFRPPFGIINPKIKRALQHTGHKVMGWNVRPYDAVTRSPERVLERITKDLKKGDLILLHDNMPKTAYILEQLLVILERRNISTIRPDKLFEIHAHN